MRVEVQHQNWAKLSSDPDQHYKTFIFDLHKTNSGLKVIGKREIMVDNMLYDVVHRFEKGRATIFYCIHDEKEQNLIAQTRLFDSMNQPVPLKNTTKLILDQIIKTALIEYQTAYHPGDRSQNYAFYNKEIYSGPVISIMSPPPQPSC